MKIAVLGSTGMLGSMLVRYLSQHFHLVATVRSETLKSEVSNAEVRVFDALNDNLATVAGDCQWIINAVGVIPQRYRYLGCEINSKVPRQIIEQTDIPIIQIATDCVYSGKRGNYSERDNFSPIDDYGESKLLGEVEAPNMHHLRCSIVGRERRGSYSLLGWFLNQSQGAIVMGYVNHLWNGVTTLHFAKVCRGIIEQSVPLLHIHHLVPADSISKYELLKLFAIAYCRDDITIKPAEAVKIINRTLATTNTELNQELWQAAGYDGPPTIAKMVRELAEYTARGKRRGK